MHELVVLESPFAGDEYKNIDYARACVRDSINRGESPIASHLLYTQDGILDDSIPNERKLGMELGLDWLRVADKQVFYVDYGMSSGMKATFRNAINNDVNFEIRRIYDV